MMQSLDHNLYQGLPCFPWETAAQIESVLAKVSPGEYVCATAIIETPTRKFPARVELLGPFKFGCLPYNARTAIEKAKIPAQILAVVALIARAYPSKLNAWSWQKIQSKDGMIIVQDIFDDGDITIRHPRLFRLPRVADSL